MKKLAAFDLVILGYIAAITLLLLIFRPPGTLTFLAYHAAVVGMIAMIIAAHASFGGRFWELCRYWYVVPVTLAAFREVHYLVPLIHPFEDFHFDHVLASLDRRLFGDVDRFFLTGWPAPFYDLLHLCYWFYYVSMLIPPIVFSVKRDEARQREYLAVLTSALFLSYLGYYAVPALGPHLFLTARPAVLDGVLVGAPLHRALLAAEWRMPDAFPSGHALMSMIVIVCSWRLHRPTFRWVVAPSLGCILATMVLRYHYVVDVAAAALVLPVAVWGGRALNRWRERVLLAEGIPKP